MKRIYNFNPFPLGFGPKGFFDLAKTLYENKYPDQLYSHKNPFTYCLIYRVIKPDKTVKFDFKFPQDVGLAMKGFAKKPKGFTVGIPIRDIDVREVTEIIIPPYENKYYFDFILFVIDITTDEYWITKLWTNTICPDLRYYMSKERKLQYHKIGEEIAQSYTRTFILGHVNLRTKELRSSGGIRKLLKNSWIPTISLLPQPYGEMIRLIESTNDMNKVNSFVVDSFNANLIDDILSRWSEVSLVKKRMEILTTALSAYKNGSFYATIYILLPQIEGIINDHIIRKRQLPQPSLKDRFNQFGEIIKMETFNTEMTIYLTNILINDLHKSFYKTWYPYPRHGRRYRPADVSPQRHVISHGKINPKYFTQENCIKLICILDAIILLSLRKSEL
jgi:hypothetical protein